MEYKIKDIINKHKGHPALVLGHGPSLNFISDDLEKYKKEGFILFDCNNWPEFHDTVPHYWVLCGYSINRLIKEGHKYEKRQYKTDVFFADSYNGNDKNVANSFIGGDYLAFRHLDTEGTLTIQEELQKFTQYDKKYNSGCTVALHMISFAILMGCNPVYTIGIDLDWTQGYARNKIDYCPIPNFSFKPYMKDFTDALTIINNSAKKVGIDIINANRNPNFPVIKSGTIVTKGEI